ncbi:MAG: methyltransferase [Hyphomicrobium sp.]
MGVLSGLLPTEYSQIASKFWPVFSPLDNWRRWRNRLLSNSHFQKKATSLPLVRTIAHHKARRLFDLCSGFVYSQILLACIRLQLFHFLAEEPKSLSQCCKKFNLPEDSLERLLEAAASLNLLNKCKDGRYCLGSYGAALLANRGIEQMIEHNALLYEDLKDPILFLKNPTQKTALSRYWAYARAKDPSKLSEQEIKNYSALMSASQPLVAEQILDAYPFTEHKHLLDVGGGEGLFLCEVGRRFPHLSLTLFDLPAVAKQAKKNFIKNKLSSRTTTLGGNFFADPLPEKKDLITLIRILHDHSDDKVLQLLHNIHKVLPKNGRLLIGEPLAETRGAEPMGAAYFGFYLLAMRSGRPRTKSELQKMLKKVGFRESYALPTRIPLQTSLLVAIP